MTFPFYIKDLDIKFINDELSDEDLARYCQINKYTRNLCKDETLWRNRFMLKHPDMIQEFGSLKEIKDRFLPDSTWRDYYIWLADATNPKTNLKPLFNMSIKLNRPDLLYLLLKNPALDPGMDNNNAIREAVKENHTDVASLLIRDNRVDPSAQYNRALTDASKNRNYKLVKMLLDDPRVDPKATMKMAYRIGDQEVRRIFNEHPRFN